MQAFEKIKWIDGQAVRRAPHTLMAAAEEVAAAYQGTVGFACPNYAVVMTHSTRDRGSIAVTAKTTEITIWMR